MNLVGLPLIQLYLRGIELRNDSKALHTEYTEFRRRQLLITIEESEPGSGKASRAQAELSYFLTSLQINSAEQGARQLALATTAIAVATVGLIAATVVLAVTHH